MKEIDLKEFLYYQPSPRESVSEDEKYLSLCNKLLKIWDESNILSEVPDELRHLVVIGLIGYFLDVINDLGVWRSFTDECKRRYGYRVPFHKETDDYLVYELNRSDVEFVIWYQLAFNSMQYRFLYPLETELLDLANLMYKELEHHYDEMGPNEDYKEFFNIELNNPEDAEKLYHFIHWFYWKSWLIFPPFQLTFSQIYPEIAQIRQTSPDPSEAKKKIEQLQHQVMSSIPTGPLAYTLKEWLALVLGGRHPKEVEPIYKPMNEEEEGLTEHPLYTAFMAANNLKPLRFIATYSELNSFFIDGLGWEAHVEHLPAMKGHSDFVLMATPHSGLMVAKNIAKSINHPANPLYSQEVAKSQAFNIISQRTVCPGDMLRYICSKGFLTDAAFPEYPSLKDASRQPSYEERREAACNNWDFLARVYLEEFYRGD